MTDDPTQESLITDNDRERINFEVPFDPELQKTRGGEAELLVQSHPDHPMAKIAQQQAEAILFDQSIGLFLPTFDEVPAQAELARRWIEIGINEFGKTLHNVEAKGPLTRNNEVCKLLTGHSSKWELNNDVVKVVDFANRFKKEFHVDKIILTLNDQESVV